MFSDNAQKGFFELTQKRRKGLRQKRRDKGGTLFRQPVVSPTCQFTKVLFCQFTKVLFCQLVISPTCQFTKVLFRQPVVSPTCQFTKFLFCQIANFTKFCFVKLLLSLNFLLATLYFHQLSLHITCQRVTTPNGHFINLSLQQFAILPICVFVNLTFCQIIVQTCHLAIISVN